MCSLFKVTLSQQPCPRICFNYVITVNFGCRGSWCGYGLVRGSHGHIRRGWRWGWFIREARWRGGGGRRNRLIDFTILHLHRAIPTRDSCFVSWGKIGIKRAPIRGRPEYDCTSDDSCGLSRLVDSIRCLLGNASWTTHPLHSNHSGSGKEETEGGKERGGRINNCYNYYIFLHQNLIMFRLCKLR